MDNAEAPQQASLIPIFFGDIRRNRFRDYVPLEREVFEYMDQLAGQTSTRIDQWEIEPFRKLARTPLDRRLINKAFFARAEAGNAYKEILDPLQEKLLESASKEMESAKVARLKTLRSEWEHTRERASTRLADGANYIGDAWRMRQEMMALEGRPANFIVDEIRKLLAGGFWDYNKYDAGMLHMTTRSHVVMTEVNKAAGINRRVDLGLYFGILNVRSMRLTVRPHKQNVLVRGHCHPYIGSDAEICWGNAANTAASLLANGQVFEAYNLLASLLTTYSDGTPWESLAGFDRKQTRIDDAVLGEHCSNCDEPEADCECERCDSCEAMIDECSCYHCEECGETFQSRCEDHWCETCETYDRQTCDCCRRCDRTDDRCTCCHECNRTNETCSRCRECDQHHGEHSNTCIRHPDNNDPDEETPF